MKEINKFSVPEIDTFQYESSHLNNLQTKYNEDEEEND